MKRLIMTLTLSLALHSLSAFASMPNTSPLATQNMIEYIDHTHQLTTTEKVQTDVVSSINKNNYLQINSHKDAHLEQREIDRRPKKKYTCIDYKHTHADS